MICASSRNPSSSELAITADPSTGGCHGPRSKHPVKIGDHLMTFGTDRRAQGEEIMNSDRHKQAC